MKKPLRIVLWLLAVGAIAAAIVIAWRPAPVTVETAQVNTGQLRVTIDAEGKTRMRHRYVIAAPITGRLTRITLERGDQVAQGSVVARLDPLPLAPLDQRQLAEAKARLTAAEQLQNEAAASVSRVQADCELAQRELIRATQLVETGDLAKQEYERVSNAARTCQQQLNAARFRERAAAAEVDVARAALLALEHAGQSGTSGTVFVKAPAAGRVLRILEESERVVQVGTPLLELSGSALEIVIDVLSADAVKIKPATPVIIEGWGGEHRLAAHVRLIEPAGFTKVSALGIEEQRVNVIADFDEAKVPLNDNYRVEARLVIWEQPRVLKVPLSALFRRSSDWYVFLIEQGQAREQRVTIGHRSALEAEVLDGLSDGTEVIVHPSNQVVAGVAVARR